jgi:hypothetical protein
MLDMTPLTLQRLRLHSPTPLVCLSALTLALNAAAQDIALPPLTDWVPYVVRQPQTISQLLDVLTLPNNPEQALRSLQDHNRPLDLNKLQTGQTIRLPKTWFRQEPTPLKVTRIRCTGKAEPSTANQQSLYAGMSLGEGDIINVPGGCQVSLSLRDGSQLQLPSSSIVQIDTLRDSSDQRPSQIKLKLLQGKISLSLFKKRPAGATFEVATPLATTGVRGTEFRVSHDANNDTSAIEVLQGQVQTQAQDSSENQIIGRHQGAVIDTQGHIQLEDLPLPPKLALQGQLWRWQNLQPSVQYVRQDLMAINDVPAWSPPQANPGTDIPIETNNALPTRYVQAATISPSGLMGAPAIFAVCQPLDAQPMRVCPVRFQIDETEERVTRLELRKQETDTSTPWTSTRPRNPRTREVIALLPPGQYEWQIQGKNANASGVDSTERVTERGQFTLLGSANTPSRP